MDLEGKKEFAAFKSLFASPAALVLKPSPLEQIPKDFWDKSKERESEFTESLDTPGLRVNKGFWLKPGIERQEKEISNPQLSSSLTKPQAAPGSHPEPAQSDGNDKLGKGQESLKAANDISDISRENGQRKQSPLVQGSSDKHIMGR